jgi:hypothetical protein
MSQTNKSAISRMNINQTILAMKQEFTTRSTNLLESMQTLRDVAEIDFYTLNKSADTQLCFLDFSTNFLEFQSWHSEATFFDQIKLMNSWNDYDSEPLRLCNQHLSLNPATEYQVSRTTLDPATKPNIIQKCFDLAGEIYETKTHIEELHLEEHKDNFAQQLGWKPSGLKLWKYVDPECYPPRGKFIVDLITVHEKLRNRLELDQERIRLMMRSVRFEPHNATVQLIRLFNKFQILPNNNSSIPYFTTKTTMMNKEILNHELLHRS